jgi:hypothetical protein
LAVKEESDLEVEEDVGVEGRRLGSSRWAAVGLTLGSIRPVRWLTRSTWVSTERTGFKKPKKNFFHACPFKC